MVFFKIASGDSDSSRLPQFEEKSKPPGQGLYYATDRAISNDEDENASVSIIFSLFRSFFIITCVAGFLWLACSSISATAAAARADVAPTIVPASLDIKSSMSLATSTEDSINTPMQQVVVPRTHVPSLPTPLVANHEKRQEIQMGSVNAELNAQKDRLSSVSSIWNDTSHVIKREMNITLSAPEQLTLFISTVINDVPLAKRIQILKDFERGSNDSRSLAANVNEQRAPDYSKAVAHWMYSMQDVQEYAATHPHELTLPTDVNTQDPEVQAKIQEKVAKDLLQKVASQSGEMTNVTDIEVKIVFDTNENAKPNTLAKRRTAGAREVLESLKAAGKVVSWSYLINGLIEMLHDLDVDATPEFDGKYNEQSVEDLTSQVERAAKNVNPELKRIIQKGMWRYKWPGMPRQEDEYLAALTRELTELLSPSDNSLAAEKRSELGSGLSLGALELHREGPKYRTWISRCETWLHVCGSLDCDCAHYDNLK